MNTVIDLLRNLWNLLACIGEVLGYFLRFVSAFFQARASLAARLVAAESQLGICKRRTEQKGSPRFRFTAGFRLRWVVLSKFWAPWQAAAQLMQPSSLDISSSTTTASMAGGAGVHGLLRHRGGAELCREGGV
jgi:hypothetical protein